MSGNHDRPIPIALARQVRETARRSGTMPSVACSRVVVGKSGAALAALNLHAMQVSEGPCPSRAVRETKTLNRPFRHAARRCDAACIRHRREECDPLPPLPPHRFINVLTQPFPLTRFLSHGKRIQPKEPTAGETSSSPEQSIGRTTRPSRPAHLGHALRRPRKLWQKFHREFSSRKLFS